MDKGENYEVKDIKLAEQGILNLEIAESRMQALMKVKERFVQIAIKIVTAKRRQQNFSVRV